MATGRAFNPAYLRDRWWYPLLRRAGLRRVHFHSLRHSAGSFLLALGMSLPQVACILGYSSVAIASAIHAHALQQGERQYVERLGDLLAVRLAVNAP